MIVTELAAKLGLEVDEQAFSRIGQVMQGLSTGLLGVAAAFGAAAVGVTGAVVATALAADEIGEAAEASGVAARTLQELGYVASRGGVGIEDLRTSLRVLARNMAEAANGSAKLQAAFKGIAVKDANGLRSIDDVLADLADKFKNTTNETERVALAQELMGRSGAKMLPMLNQGSAAIDKLRGRARELGLVFDEATLAAGSEFDDAINDLKLSFVGLRNSIGGPLIKDLASLTKSFVSLMVKSRQWIAVPIVKTAKAIAKATAVLVENLDHFAIALGTVALVLTFKYVPAMIAAKLSTEAFGWASIVWAAKTAAAWVSAAAATIAAWLPWILLAAVLFLIFDDIYTYATDGRSALEEWGMAWTKFLDRVLTPVEGDHWLVATIQDIARMIFDFSGWLDRMGEGWSLTFRVLGNSIKEMWNGIVEWITEAIRSIPGVGWVLGKLGGSGGAASPAAADPFAGTGGAASPTASAAVTQSVANSSNMSTDARSFTAPITVNVPAGSDAQAIGGAVSSSLDEWWNNELRAGYAAAST
jgi:hypothetical protein